MDCSWIISWYFIAFIGLFYTNALENGLARTPPMGFMTWQRYRCIIDCDLYPDECISERLIKNVADQMAMDGYKDVGYEYVIIDDCWLESERDPNTQELVADRIRFPSGIKALADYVHNRGLKLGIYQDYGTNTCAGYPGLIGHLELDANTFAKWEIDYIKVDGCYADIHDLDNGYPEFGRLLNVTGRPIVYSCSWPVYQEVSGIMPNYEMLKKYCNLWRNWGDIDDSYIEMRAIIDYFAENQQRIQPHGGPGHWNDPDMLIIGNFGLSYEQSKLQMAIWAILAAPLLMSADLKAMRPEFKEILQNKNIIDVNQDILGIQGLRQSDENQIECWARPITPIVDGSYSYAIAWVSKRYDGTPFDINVKLSDLGLNHTLGYRVKNLFDNNSELIIENSDDLFTTRVNPSGVVFYKFTPCDIQEISYKSYVKKKFYQTF